MRVPDEENDSLAPDILLLEGGGKQVSDIIAEAESAEPNVKEVEKILDYKFSDEKLLLEALIHPSFSFPVKSCISYERLEYIGDSVLNLLVARELFFLYPDLPPGLLTKLRAANVDNEKLARVAVRHSLHDYLRHKAPHLQEQIQEFSQAVLDYPVHSNGLIDTPKVLADIVESLVGAVFVDCHSSLETVWQVFKRLLEPIISLETLGTHPVTELFEFCQKKRLLLPRFVKDSWNENTAVDVFIGDLLVGTATCGNKKEIAQNRAAKAALDYLKATTDL
ncbi:ribonuclease 3-like protein 3 [Telopea speciosissima]|uniref:ribonuclease 3-like protein 3 n=1 Tax=Telopea speciosissima TaxID=54955 RepID=UPI001CC6E882|nr:ribonuclease 3-like protein 3 [Telopea speciosissima]